MNKVFILLLLALELQAHTFNISKTSELRTALTNAATNGEDNTIILADGTYYTTDDDGGGTFIYSSSEEHNLTLRGSSSSHVILSGSHIQQIFQHTTTGGKAPLKLEKLSFVDGNNTSESGGGVYTDYSIDVLDCNFSNNSTSNYGGGFYADFATIVKDSTFTNNRAHSGSGSGFNSGAGGGFYSHYSTIVKDSTFTNNRAYSSSGGGFYVFSVTDINTTVINSIFTDNSARDGGGFNSNSSATTTVINSIFKNNSVYSGSGGGFSAIVTTVKNSTFTNNSAGVGGGFSASSSAVNNSTFTNNSTSKNGGGFNSGFTTVNNSIFTNNSTGKNGGGFSASNSIVKNSTFTNNNASGTGGGFNSDDFYETTVINSKFTNNSSNSFGGGFTSSSFLKASNLLLSKNSSGIYIKNGTKNIIENSIFIDNNISDIDGASGVIIQNLENNYLDISKLTVSNFHKNNIFEGVTLGFIDEANGDYNLTISSDLIDAGTTSIIALTLPTTDMNGNTRVIGSNIDIGPYEFSSTKPIISEISFSGNAKAYSTLTFTAISIPSGNRTIASTEYDFTNSGIFTTTNTTSYPAGTYTVKVKVTDSEGEYSISKKEITIVPLPFNEMTLEQKLAKYVTNADDLNSIISDINGGETVSTALTIDNITNLPTGWSNIGTPTNITDLSIFVNTTIVWIYNNEISSWSAYSSDVKTAQAIENSSKISTITSVPAGSGIWVLK